MWSKTLSCVSGCCCNISDNTSPPPPGKPNEIERHHRGNARLNRDVKGYEYGVYFQVGIRQRGERNARVDSARRAERAINAWRLCAGRQRHLREARNGTVVPSGCDKVRGEGRDEAS